MKKHLGILLPILIISGCTNNIDIDLLSSINLNRPKQLDGIFRDITNSAGPVAFSLPVLLLGIGLLKKDTLKRQRSYYVGASVLSSAIISNILKYSVNRPRPFLTYSFIEKVTSGASPSFPSDHTSDAFALATAVSLIWPKWYVIIPSYAWACAVGYSRMDLGVHYPSEVLAGAIIGAGSAYLCSKGQQWLLNKRKK
jgi:membrane-associated phospholipid phosphatase